MPAGWLDLERGILAEESELYSADRLMENVQGIRRSRYDRLASGAVSANDLDVLVAAYAGFNARAIDAVLALMHPDVDWPNGIDGGRVHGHDSVREYWARQWSLIDPHAEPVGFRSEEDGKITVTVHLTIRRLDGTAIVDENVEHCYLMENGLIRRMDFGGEEV